MGLNLAIRIKNNLNLAMFQLKINHDILRDVASIFKRYAQFSKYPYTSPPPAQSPSSSIGTVNLLLLMYNDK